MPYVATMNTPGYLPMADEPDIFDTPAEAWEFLAGEREFASDMFEAIFDIEDDGPSVLRTRTGEGSITLPTIGTDSTHDLGIAYSVSYVSDSELAGVV